MFEWAWVKIEVGLYVWLFRWKGSDGFETWRDGRSVVLRGEILVRLLNGYFLGIKRKSKGLVFSSQGFNFSIGEVDIVQDLGPGLEMDSTSIERDMSPQNNEN